MHVSEPTRAFPIQPARALLPQATPWLAWKTVSNVVLALVVTACLFLLIAIPHSAAAQSTPVPPAQCGGNDGNIEVPWNGGFQLLKVGELATLVGTYCNESTGLYESGSAARTPGDCRISISETGVFTAHAAGHTLEIEATFLATNIAIGMTPERTTYAVLASSEIAGGGGREMLTVEVDIHLKRVVGFGAERFRLVDGKKQSLELMLCALRRTSTAGKMGAGRLSYVTAENIDASLVGVHRGTARTVINGKNVDVACSAEVAQDGKITVNSPKVGESGGGIHTLSAQLNGELYDSISDRGVTIQAVDRGTSWSIGERQNATTTLTLTNGLVPARADAAGSIPDVMTESLESCIFSPPGDSDGGAPHPEKGGLGGMDCRMTGGTNPINVANGNKYQHEVDFAGSASVGLSFERHYNSDGRASSANLGAHWRTNYDRSLTWSADHSTVRANRADGKVVEFTLDGASWRNSADGTDLLLPATGSPLPDAAWSYRTKDDETEIYSSTGRLLQLRSRQGLTQTLMYDPAGSLVRVTDSFNHALALSYDSQGRIATMSDPAGGTFAYTYGSSNNLVAVEAPGSPARTTRRYWYDDPANPNALTGIEDENGDRFSTWKYDAQGRAYLSEHGGGADRRTITFSPDGTSTVTDPLGTQRSFKFFNILGVTRYGGQTQPAGAGCGAAANAVSYDRNGNVKSETDFKGTVTSYEYDLNRNLETSRVEAAGTHGALFYSTAWHPVYRVPVQIAGPRQIVTYAYYPDGKLQGMAMQATSDTDGASRFNAQLVGRPRTQRFTYNGSGLLETVIGPRTDLVQKETYTYDPDTGNLATYQNALGQLTTYSDYNLLGQAGTIVLPNRATIKLSYTPRGLLQSQLVVSGEDRLLTSFEYDAVGALKKVVFPNGSRQSFLYDSAHRLTDINDSAGNTVHYELDAIGNRIATTLKDANGNLEAAHTRVIDALNRVKTLSKGAQ
jgi:YD repeat-containing protein